MSPTKVGFAIETLARATPARAHGSYSGHERRLSSGLAAKIEYRRAASVVIGQIG
jgi:hypothetical protein